MPSRSTNKKVSGVNVKQTVFLIISGVNIISLLIYYYLSYTHRKDSSNNRLHLLLTKLIIVRF